MANLEFGDLQAELKRILLKPRTKQKVQPVEPDVHYLEPRRACRVWDILVTDDFDPHKSIVEVWQPNYLAPPVGKQIVYHSHPVGKVCFASDFCHEYGYKPTGAENPKFIQAFYRKWRCLYGDKNMDSSSSNSSSSSGVFEFTFLG